MVTRPRKREIVPVVEPRIQFLYETETSKSVSHEPDQRDLLAVYGYVEREYLISGIAVGETYCTRLLLRCPADAMKFSGLVIEEPAHLWGGTTMWKLINRWIMRNGHAWLEVDSQAPAAIDQIKNIDPDRYKAMHFKSGPSLTDFMKSLPTFVDVSNKNFFWSNYKKFKSKWWAATSQSPEILTAASYVLRIGCLGVNAQWIILTGLCQTGDVTRKFIVESAHLRLPNRCIPFEGYMPCQSDGGPVLLDQPGAKVIEVLGELELMSIQALCAVSGKVEGTPHRRFDSDSFRLYEIPGLSHRETRYLSMAELKRLSTVDLAGARWSTFASSFVYNAIFDAMEKWITLGIFPPRGAVIKTSGRSEDIQRDAHGNAIGGIRTVHTDVPTANIIDFSPKDRPHWYNGTEDPFTPTRMWAIYNSVGNYRRLASDAIERQLRAGFLLKEDAEILRRDTIEQVTF